MPKWHIWGWHILAKFHWQSHHLEGKHMQLLSDGFTFPGDQG